MSLSLHTLPVEMIYRILDHLKEEQLFLAMSNVSQRFNAILDSYPRYHVFYMIYFGCKHTHAHLCFLLDANNTRTL